MKRYLPMVLTFVLFVAFLAAVSLADLKEGLVAYWPLDGNAEDIVGGNDGEVMGEPDWLSGADAWIGEGTLLCDGLDDRILAGNFNPSDGTDELTVSLWVFLNECKETQFLKKGDDWSDNNMMWQFEIHEDGELSIGRSGSQYDFGIIIPFKEWVHLAVTVAEDKAILYFNGEPVSDGEFIMGTGTESTLRIGATQIPHRFIDGMLDEVLLYNRAIEPDEIKRLAEGINSAIILSVEPAAKLITTWGSIRAQH